MLLKRKLILTDTIIFTRIIRRWPCEGCRYLVNEDCRRIKYNKREILISFCYNSNKPLYKIRKLVSNWNYMVIKNKEEI